jgi:hypothetical protein
VGGRKVQMYVGMTLEPAVVLGFVGIEVVENDVNFGVLGTSERKVRLSHVSDYCGVVRAILGQQSDCAMAAVRPALRFRSSSWPLLGQTSGADDETALQVAAHDQFLDE